MKTLFTLTISEQEDGRLTTYSNGIIYKSDLIAELEIFLLRMKMSVINDPNTTLATGEFARQIMEELTPDNNKKEI